MNPPAEDSLGCSGSLDADFAANIPGVFCWRISGCPPFVASLCRCWPDQRCSTLTNQLGQAVTLRTCGDMYGSRTSFLRVRRAVPQDEPADEGAFSKLAPTSNARLVSLTTDPGFDTPAGVEGLRRTIPARLPVDGFFLTGSKQEVANLAGTLSNWPGSRRKPEERESPVDLFIHSTIFVIVDKSGQIAGIFQTTGEDIDPQKVKKEIQALFTDWSGAMSPRICRRSTRR